MKYPFQEKKVYVDEVIKDEDEIMNTAVKEDIFYDQLLSSITQCKACNIINYKKDLEKYSTIYPKKVFFIFYKKPEQNQMKEFKTLLQENEINPDKFHFIYSIRCNQSNDFSCCFPYTLEEILLLNPYLFITFGEEIKNFFDQGKEYNKIYNFQEKIAWLPFFKFETILNDEKVKEIFIEKIKNIYSKIS
jgi:hypothetical protein